MNRLRFLFPAACLVLALSALVTLPSRAGPGSKKAAQITATPIGIGFVNPVNVTNPDVVITSPILVSELHGQVEINGTANLPNMRSYFLETRVLNADASPPPDDAPWIPTTLPMFEP